MTSKQAIGFVLDGLIVICMAACLFLAHRAYGPGVHRRIATAAFLAPAVAVLAYEAVCWGRQRKQAGQASPSISTLILLGEDDRPIRIWDLTGKVGLLIGKSTEEYSVDIDLAGTAYETLIDVEHAVINYHHSGWWIQDTSSRNGVTIIRKGEELLIGHHAPIRLQLKDIITVAKYTRIAVN